MILRTNVKLNFGLNVLRKRDDGYHDIETLFVPCHEFGDTLEVISGDDYSRTSASLFARYGGLMDPEGQPALGDTQPQLSEDGLRLGRTAPPDLGGELAQGISEDGKLMITIAREEGIDWDPLKDLCGPDDPYHVVAIKRKGETIIPGGNDELKCYDLAYFMTTKQYIPYIRKIVGKEHYVDVKNVMIMGGGATAVRAVQSMPEYMNTKIFEVNPDRCDELNQLLNDQALVINADPRDMGVLTDEGIYNTQAFVSLTGNAETNILACLAAKRMGVRKTVAMVESMGYASMAESLDIGTIINKKAIAASRIYQLMLDADVMNVTFLLSANADVAEFIPKPDSKVTRKPVKDLGLPQGMTIGGLVRGGEGMLVSGNTQIQAGDDVVVFCHNVNMKKIEKFFN